MDEVGYKACLHEGAHFGTSIMLGWNVEGVSRTAGWDAETLITPRIDGDVMQRGLELAAITVSPFVLGYEGLADDLRILTTLAEASVPISKARELAEHLVRSARHWYLRNAVADALIKRPVLTAEDLQNLLQ